MAIDQTQEPCRVAQHEGFALTRNTGSMRDESRRAWRAVWRHIRPPRSTPSADPVPANKAYLRASNNSRYRIPSAWTGTHKSGARPSCPDDPLWGGPAGRAAPGIPGAVPPATLARPFVALSGEGHIQPVRKRLRPPFPRHLWHYKGRVGGQARSRVPLGVHSDIPRIDSYPATLLGEAGLRD